MHRNSQVRCCPLTSTVQLTMVSRGTAAFRGTLLQPRAAVRCQGAWNCWSSPKHSPRAWQQAQIHTSYPLGLWGHWRSASVPYCHLMQSWCRGQHQLMHTKASVCDRKWVFFFFGGGRKHILEVFKLRCTGRGQLEEGWKLFFQDEVMKSNW